MCLWAHHNTDIGLSGRVEFGWVSNSFSRPIHPCCQVGVSDSGPRFRVLVVLPNHQEIEGPRSVAESGDRIGMELVP